VQSGGADALGAYHGGNQVEKCLEQKVGTAKKIPGTASPEGLVRSTIRDIRMAVLRAPSIKAGKEPVNTTDREEKMHEPTARRKARKERVLVGMGGLADGGRDCKRGG